MTNIVIRKEFKDLIPPLSSDEFTQLEKNILSDGIRDPLVVWNDILIDGHNRYAIATKYGLPFEIVKKDFADENEATRWIILNQFGRRNLSAYDRSILALKLKPVIAAEAKKNLVTHTEEGYQPLQKSAKPVDTRAELAKVAGVSHDTIAKVEKIEREAKPELKAAVKSGEKSINQAYKEIKQEEKKAAREAIIAKQIEKPKTSNHVDIFSTQKKYRVVYADPPWSYNDECKDGGIQSRGASGVYPTMTISEICDLPVPSEDNAVLFLWVTSPLLEDAFKVIKAWGFKYKSSFVWDKVAHNMGHYNSVRHEFLLICTKGSCTPDVVKLYDSVVSIERTEHSRKPKEFRDMIDTLYPVGERLEMFAREAPDGWDVWGNMA